MSETPAPAAPLGAGDAAPALAVDTHRGARWSAAEPGAPTILVFIPAAFTPVCGGELEELLVLRERAAEQGVEIVVASCDSTAVLDAWLREHGASEAITGASDFWPHGELARGFGALDERTGQARRVSFALGADGTVLANVASLPGDPRTLAMHARLLRAIAKAQAAA